MARLTKDEIITMHVFKSKNHSNCEIARKLGVCEGAVRYHLRRGRTPEDGRSGRPMAADSVAEEIRLWMEAHDNPRDRDLKLLHAWLREEHGWRGSYSALWRFVTKHYGKPARRPRRRVETPPGAQAQVDWMEVRDVDLCGVTRETVYGFVMVLSSSRKPVVIWCRSMNQLMWHRAHNEAFLRIGGIAAVIRIDNLKTGVSHGAGAWGETNPAYAAFARSLGFHVDKCPVRHPQAKGKVETRISRIRSLLQLTSRRYESLEDLQRQTDELLEAKCREWECPVTGTTIEEAWLKELEKLRPLPFLAEPFDVCVERKVNGDCTISFEGRTYSVPFHLSWKRVEVRGCAETIEVYYDGRLQATHPRGTKEKLLINPDHYEGKATEDRLPPFPLGRMGSRIMELVTQEVDIPAAEMYERLAEVR